VRREGRAFEKTARERTNFSPVRKKIGSLKDPTGEKSTGFVQGVSKSPYTQCELGFFGPGKGSDRFPPLKTVLREKNP